MTTYNFPDHVKGNTFKSREFQVLQNDAPVDITDYTINMHLKHRKGDDEEIVFDFADHIEIHEPEEGKFKINDVNIDIPAWRYYYDILFQKQDDEFTYLSGIFQVIKKVTNIIPED